MKLRETWERTKNGIERMNQLILCFPVWLVLVAGKPFLERGEGWEESEGNERYERMY